MFLDQQDDVHDDGGDDEQANGGDDDVNQAFTQSFFG